jgi:hypothetical protein
VPGSVDHSRRNYRGPFEALRKINNPSPLFQVVGTNYQLCNKFEASETLVLCLNFGIPRIVSDDFPIDNTLKDRALVYPE